MPFRSLVTPAALRLRLFSTSAIRRAEQSHYEILGISVNATPAEIKKSFYALSKTHHPDLNPHDPHASHRFIALSTAYTTLRNPSKRAQYDREVLRTHSPPHNPHTHGSYSSTNPVGGRPASGLSRRRTQFRGPPPSFFRSGGYGEHASKRKAAQEEQGGRPSGKEARDHHAGPGSESTAGGMGHGQSPFGRGDDVRHFDRESHLRTHAAHERRRRTRRPVGEGYYEGEQPAGMVWQFLVLTGLVGLGVLIPALLFGQVAKAGEIKRKEK